MDDGDRFFGEGDPEWAVSQLAAQVAETTATRRRVSWHIVCGSVLTTVLVVGAFVLGLRHEPAAQPLASTSEPEPTSVAPAAPLRTPVRLPRARRVTLAPKPVPSPTPTPTPTPSPVVADAPAPVEPDQPSNQVGPNRPITTPIDPDDR